MITFKENDEIVRINKIDPCQLDIKDVFLVVSKYADETTAMDIAKSFMTMLGYNDIVFIQRETRVYELSFPDWLCSVSESKKYQKLKELLLEKGINCDVINECAISLLFLDDKTIQMENEKIKREQEKNSSIAREMPSWMPANFKYLMGNMYDGIVITDQYGNQFTYIPYLEIYVSRYEISLNDYGVPASVPGRRAWVNVDYKTALKAATEFSALNNSDLLTNVNDIMEAIRRKTGKSVPDIVYEGNIELRTGAMSENMIYNIDCLSGNHFCMMKTSNNYRKSALVHGQSYKIKDVAYYQNYIERREVPSRQVGFRICLKKES